MFENTPSDRVQVVGRGDLLHPGSCALCGSGTCDEGYVDTGIYYDYEGQVYFCRTCTIQIAEVIGCLIPEEAKELKKTANEALAKLRSVTEQLEAANERLRAFDVAFASVKFPDDPSATVSDVVSEVATGADETDKAPASSADAGESVAKEPIKVKRRNDPKRDAVRDLTSGHSRIEL